MKNTKRTPISSQTNASPRAQRSAPKTVFNALESGDLYVGFKGKRYGVCVDGLWHLVLEMPAERPGAVEVQCGMVEYLDMNNPYRADAGVCQECLELHALSNKSKT